MQPTEKDRVAATRPGQMESDRAVLAAIGSGSGQPRGHDDRRRYVLSDTHRQGLLLLLGGAALGYVAGMLLTRSR